MNPNDDLKTLTEKIMGIMRIASPLCEKTYQQILEELKQFRQEIKEKQNISEASAIDIQQAFKKVQNLEAKLDEYIENRPSVIQTQANANNERPDIENLEIRRPS